MLKFLKTLMSTKASTPAPAVDEFLALRSQASQALDEGRLSEALSLYERMAAREPTNATALTAWGFALQQAGRNHEARRVLTTAADLAPQLADAPYLLGELAQAASQPGEAVAYYRSALQAQPDFEPACGPLCQLLYQQGDLAGAAAVMRRALEHHPGREDFHLFAGNVALAQGDAVRAIQAFEQALALQPGFHAARTNLFVALEANGDKERALALAREMLAADPARPELRLTLGRLVFEQVLSRWNDNAPHAVADADVGTPDVDGTPPLKLVVEGWRGINHSFALIHQFQMLELLRRRDVVLSCRDLDFPLPHWSARSISAGFAPAEQARIDGVPVVGEGAPADCVYRISVPYLAPQPDDARRTFTCMITEYGLTQANFAGGDANISRFTAGGNRVVTSSMWSKQRLVDEGLDEADIDIVTCGVNREVFAPASQAQRAAWRNELGLQAHEFVFLNLGAAFWNKGIDLLMRAFATLRQRRRDIRLILKDQRTLYATTTTEATLRDLSNKHPALFTADTLDAITLVGSSLSQARLARLYGVADCYVSPYRAEGFNLPVLEALSCAVPVIVTDGGSTDDFCPPGVATRLPSRMLSRDSTEPGRLARYREPDFDALVASMSLAASGDGLDRATFLQELDRLLPTKTWTFATSELMGLMRR